MKNINLSPNTFEVSGFNCKLGLCDFTGSIRAYVVIDVTDIYLVSIHKWSLLDDGNVQCLRTPTSLERQVLNVTPRLAEIDGVDYRKFVLGYRKGM